MWYPPLIETMVQSLRSFAPGEAERASVEVVNLREGGRAVVMRYGGGVEVKVTGATGAASTTRHCAVQMVQSGVVVSKADGVPAAGVGRVAKALHECLQEQGLRITPDEVIATFADKVRAHKTSGFDTVRTVAEDPHGEVWLEVVDHAYRLGFDIEGRAGNGRQLLWHAFRDYQDRLRTELGASPGKMSA